MASTSGKAVMVQNVVDPPFQCLSDGFLGEGVDDQRNGRGGKTARLGIAKRQQVRQETDGQAVEFQGEGDQACIDKGGPNNQADAEQVVDKHRVPHSGQKQNGGQRPHILKGEVVERIGHSTLVVNATRAVARMPRPISRRWLWTTGVASRAPRKAPSTDAAT